MSEPELEMGKRGFDGNTATNGRLGRSLAAVAVEYGINNNEINENQQPAIPKERFHISSKPMNRKDRSILDYCVVEISSLRAKVP